MKHIPISEKQREQEWNISRKELMEIVEIGILSEAELEQIISSDFNPVRPFRSQIDIKYYFCFIMPCCLSIHFFLFFLLCRIDADLRIKVKFGWRTFLILVFRKLSAGTTYKSAFISLYCASFKILENACCSRDFDVQEICKTIEYKYTIEQICYLFVLMA